MITLEQKFRKSFGEMRWYCPEITGAIDEYYNSQYGRCSYMMLYDVSKDFNTAQVTGTITFAIRYPGSTIGYIKCSAIGLIIEAKFYKDSCVNDDYTICEVFEKFVNNEFIATNNLRKIEFVNNSKKNNSKANEQILWFIADFVYFQGNNNADCIQSQFMNGYCLHFASMLKSLFHEGEVCWCAPFGHIAYVEDGIPYDIEGVCTSDCHYYIPISYIKEGTRDFVRIPGVGFNASEEYIQDAIKRYEEDMKKKEADNNDV